MEKDNGYRALIVDGVKILETKHVDATTIDGYEVPVDPADETECGSCQ